MEPGIFGPGLLCCLPHVALPSHQCYTQRMMQIKRTLTAIVLAGAVGVGGYTYGQQTVTAAPPAADQMTLRQATSLESAVRAVCPAQSPSQPITAPQAPVAAPVTASTGVNLNTATTDELEALPGIGKATAKRIIAARPIAAVADVAKLPGVTAERFAQFQSQITV